jgi:hypothetical protein
MNDVIGIFLSFSELMQIQGPKEQTHLWGRGERTASRDNAGRIPGCLRPWKPLTQFALADFENQ